MPQIQATWDERTERLRRTGSPEDPGYRLRTISLDEVRSAAEQD